MGVAISPLKYPTTAICCFPDAKGYAITSIEGRCGVKYVDLSANKIESGSDFCFKCHRIEDASSGQAKVHSVNGLAFNKQFGSFATYGADGCYFFWNKDTRSRLKASKTGPSPVTAGDFLENGTMFAYAYGYDWGKGVEEFNANKQKY